MKPRHLAMLVALFAGQSLAADPPGIVNTQGRITVNGTNYGSPTPPNGYSKFAFVSGQATETFWTNDRTSTGTPGGEPATAVPVLVSNGHYSLALGDTSLPNMRNPVPASLFESNDHVHLRTWFATRSSGPFELLQPDRRIASNPYALHAARAAGVSVNGITSAMLANGSVTTSKIANGAVGATQLAARAAEGNLDDAGSLGIGLNGADPRATVHLNGKTPFAPATVLAELVDGVDGFQRLNNASSVTVTGSRAYLVSGADNAVSIVDVSDPASPILRAEMVGEQGSEFVDLGGALSVATIGTTVYVASFLSDTFSVIDASNASDPELLTVFRASGGIDLDGANRVFISGSTAYVTARNDSALTIFDVTTPSAPTLLTSVRDGMDGFSELGGAFDVFVSGTTAYVASFDDNSLTIIDVTTPGAPMLLAELKDGTDGFNELEGAIDVFVENDVAYVSALTDDAITVIDVRDPSSPVLLTELKDGTGGFDDLDGVRSVFVSGTTAYAAAQDDSALTIMDVAAPSAPDLLAVLRDDEDGFNRLGGARDVQVRNGIAYIAAQSDAAFSIIDLEQPVITDLITTHRVGIGTDAPDSMLHVGGDAQVEGRLTVAAVQGIQFAGGGRMSWSSGRFLLNNGMYMTGPIKAGGSFPLFVDYHALTAFIELPESGAMDGLGDLFVGEDVEIGAGLYLSGALFLNTEESDQVINFFEDGSETGESLKWDNSSDRFEFSENAAITSSGNTPQLRLEQTSPSSFARLELATIDGGTWEIAAQSGATGDLRFYNGSANRMILADNGDLAIDGTLSQRSDRHRKENIRPVDAAAVLQKVAALPIARWNYRDDREATPHIGPMSQDFHAAFQVGGDERRISSLDADGVALAAIQGLHAKVESENRKLRAENHALRRRLEDLEARLESLALSSRAN